MPRTTLDIDGTVLEQLRERAARERKSMGQVASERLAASLGADPSVQPASLGWIRRDMGKTLVDVDDKDALSAVLDAEDRQAR